MTSTAFGPLRPHHPALDACGLGLLHSVGALLSRIAPCGTLYIQNGAALRHKGADLPPLNPSNLVVVRGDREYGNPVRAPQFRNVVHLPIQDDPPNSSR